MKSLFTILFLSLNCLAFSKTGCEFLKYCELKPNDGKNAEYTLINNKKLVEYFENGKYVIKSDLKWISDCEFNATITKITLPNFPYKRGDVVNIKFEKIEGENITGTKTVRGNKLSIKYIRMK